MPASISKAHSLALLPESERLKYLKRLSDHEADALRWGWEFWARPEQLAPDGDWTTWLMMAGRGSGKTRSGAEIVRTWAEAGIGPIALVARTPSDVRDTMIHGPAGIMTVSPPWFKPKHESSKRRLTWPNGVTATTFSSYMPEALRGPGHARFWADEVAAWKYPQQTWDMLMMGMREGDKPRGVATTTPRPIKLIKQLMAATTTAVSTGTTYDNRANLPTAYFEHVIARYAGTTLGRQELLAELLGEVDGALWTLAIIDDTRVKTKPDLVRVAVAIDPPGSSTGAEAGIIAAGIAENGHVYVFSDVSRRGRPDQWARSAISLYDESVADCIVGEVNNGGEMVGHVVKSTAKDMTAAGDRVGAVKYKAVHASRGKHARAEPIAALYEQKKVHHVGVLSELEDQMTTWVPGDKSPDRMDALVWCLTELTERATLDTSGMQLPMEAGRRASRWRE